MMPEPENSNREHTRDETGDAWLLEKLPLEITRTETQKKRSDRLSLFHKEQFLAGVSTTIADRLVLHAGSILTQGLLRKIRQEEDREKAFASGYSLIAIRDHSEQEFIQKLKRRGFSDEIVQSCRRSFADKDLLNDERFAVQFAQGKFSVNAWGPSKILSALRRKGISEAIARKALKDTFQEDDATESCIQLIQKREAHFRREVDPIKRKQKVFRFLHSKGYTMDVIHASSKEIEWLC